MSLDYSQLVLVLGTLLCLLGIVACIHTARARFGSSEGRKQVSLGITHLPAESAEKIVALLALLLLPGAAIFIANWHTFEGVHEVSGCGSCHVMQPMITDMKDPNSGTLAARHYKNGWIATDQCFHCHSDYGFNGSMEAKMTGYRHLARFTTRTYHEPIQARVRFDNKNCLNCHGNTLKFKAVKSHITGYDKLVNNKMICLNCHGQAHPTRLQRTPGSSDYARLMGAAQ